MIYLMEVLWWVALGVAGGLVMGTLARPTVLRARARERKRNTGAG